MCNCGTEIETTKQFLASERHNLHDDLCVIDPPVISFDEESLLNALLYDILRNTSPYYTKPSVNMCSTSPKVY